jgi:hypothetical protein
MKSRATGQLKTLASELGLSEAVRLIDQTLAEEKKTDVLFNRDSRNGRQPGSGSGLNWKKGEKARQTPGLFS